MSKTSLGQSAVSYRSDSTKELPLVTDDFNFSALPIRSDTALLQKISNLNVGQELYLDSESFCEVTTTKKDPLVIQHIQDQYGYSIYKISIKNHNNKLWVHLSDGSNLVLQKAALLRPGSIITNFTNSLQLPDFSCQVDPYFLLRAPIVDLNTDVLASDSLFKAYKGETLYGQYCAVSHIGEGARKSNEDGFLKLDTSLGNSELFVFDGIGGAKAGEVACDVIARHLAHNLRLNFSVEDSLANCAKALEHVHRELAESVLEGDNNTSSMGACLAGIEISRHNARFYNLGDCQGLLLQDSPNGSLNVTYRTPIRTLPYDLLRAGRITQDEFQTRRDKNVITTSISLYNGIANRLRLDSSHPLKIDSDNLVVLGSDGLFDNLSVEDIIKICNEHKSPEKILRALFVATRKVVTENNGKDDNLTILVYKHDMPTE